MYQEAAAACKLDEMLGFLRVLTALRLAGGANCSGTDKKRKSQPASTLHGKVHTALLPRKPADNLTKPAFSVMNLHQMSFLGFGVTR